MSGFQLFKKAEQDLKEIYQYGYRQHGERQTDRYTHKLEKAFGGKSFDLPRAN